jgi:ribonuclease D
MPQRPPDVNPQILAGDLSEDLLQAYLAGPDLAVDTETMGLQTRRDRLCLVQLCNREAQAAIVQLPAGTFDASRPPASRAPRLKRLLEDPRVLKVFHFARFDVAALRHWLGIDVAPLYCTRTASKLARTYTDRHGLKDNLLEFLDVELDKVTRHSDWSSPTLSREQIAYAIADVTLLLPLMDRLAEMLRRQGRSELAAECFRVIPTLGKLDLAGFDLLFEH